MITSLQNEQVKQVVALHNNKGRRDQGQYLIEGKRFVQEAFLRKAPIGKIYYFLSQDTQKESNHERIEQLVAQATRLGVDTEEVSEKVMQKMSATAHTQGILATVRIEENQWSQISIAQNDILLIIDRIQDPGNLGTILRTALAAGVKQVILTKGTVDLFNPKALRSSMGAIFSQCILIEKEPEEIVNFCIEQNCRLVVSSLKGKSIFETPTWDQSPLALVIGSEAEGVSDFFVEKSDAQILLPMQNEVESLNAAIATGIFLYELRRQVQFL